jgi:hypothetical protein
MNPLEDIIKAIRLHNNQLVPADAVAQYFASGDAFKARCKELGCRSEFVSPPDREDFWDVERLELIPENPEQEEILGYIYELPKDEHFTLEKATADEAFGDQQAFRRIVEDLNCELSEQGDTYAIRRLGPHDVETID